jgi:hypothetical protein
VSTGEREEEEGDFLEGACGVSAAASSGAARASAAQNIENTGTRLGHRGPEFALLPFKEFFSSLSLSLSLSFPKTAP